MAARVKTPKTTMSAMAGTEGLGGSGHPQGEDRSDQVEDGEDAHRSDERLTSTDHLPTTPVLSGPTQLRRSTALLEV
jgi:hypothetical protein